MPRKIILLLVLIIVFMLSGTCWADTKEVSSKLESWVGDYGFYEYAPPNQNMVYRISIYNANSSYYAKIEIDGFQTLKRLQANVIGNDHSIKLVFDEYLPGDQHYRLLYNKGDILLSFEKTSSNMYTYWWGITPMLKANGESGQVYFISKPKQ